MSNHNQMAPNSASLLSTPKGINQRAAFTDPSTVTCPTATDISDSMKIRTSISEAAPHSISCCGGAANLLSRSHGLESIEDETAALEWSRLHQNQVRNHVFGFSMQQKHTTLTNCFTTHPHRLGLAPNSCSLSSTQ